MPSSHVRIMKTNAKEFWELTAKGQRLSRTLRDSQALQGCGPEAQLVPSGLELFLFGPKPTWPCPAAPGCLSVGFSMLSFTSQWADVTRNKSHSLFPVFRRELRETAATPPRAEGGNVTCPPGPLDTLRSEVSVVSQS